MVTPLSLFVKGRAERRQKLSAKRAALRLPPPLTIPSRGARALASGGRAAQYHNNNDFKEVNIMYIIYVTDYNEYHSIYPMALYGMEVYRAINTAENAKRFLFVEMLHAIEIYHMPASSFMDVVEQIKHIAVIDNQLEG